MILTASAIPKESAKPERLLNVVTSFNEAGYKRYGREFVETFVRYWPRNVRLTVYYEGDNFDFVPGVSWHPIEEVAHLAEYMASLRFPIMHGIAGDKYDINFDARMGRKAFIEMHALRKYGGKVFWIDADVVTFAHVPPTFLDDMLPDNALNCYLGRDGWYYTESGFIGFNAAHPWASRFAKNYLHVFITGVIFTQPGWHDCFGFDAVRQIMGNGPEFVNLAAALPYGTMHPFVNSILGSYMDHRKGARKESRSTEKDLVVERSESYWQTKQGNGAHDSQKSAPTTPSVIALPR